MLNVVHQLSCLDPESSSGGRFFKGDSSRHISSLRGGTTKQSPLQILRYRLLQQMKNLLRNDGLFERMY